LNIVYLHVLFVPLTYKKSTCDSICIQMEAHGKAVVRKEKFGTRWDIPRNC